MRNMAACTTNTFSNPAIQMPSSAFEPMNMQSSSAIFCKMTFEENLTLLSEFYFGIENMLGSNVKGVINDELLQLS